ncbi:MAG: hypothetical protein OEM41_10160, partial [Ignavibacteria bacterium]|nr:hypothetical protein [Ignavibacteria bacterium]
MKTQVGVMVVVTMGILLSVCDGSAQEFHRGEAEPEIAESSVPTDSLGRPGPHVARLQWFDMFKNIPNDWARYSSITFTTENVPAIIGMTAVTVALIVADEATWRASDSWYRNSNVVHTGSDIFEWFGDGRTQFGLAAGFAAYGFAAGDDRALRTASQTTEAILA